MDSANTKYEKFDIKDISWWPKRELGSPDDPYNQIPKIETTDPLHQEYLNIAESNFNVMLEEYEKEEGWVLMSEQDGIRIEYKDDPDNPIRAFRGSGIIHATAEIIRLSLIQLDIRQYWDPAFIGGHYHMEVSENVRLVYYSFKAPWPVTNRDFFVCAGEKITDDGIVLSAVSSIEREDCPEKEGFVRGILGPSGFIVKPLENEDDGRPRCMVTYLAQVNPMGWIPAMIVNTVNVEQPMCILSIKNQIALTQVMAEESLTKLFEISEDSWNAKVIRRTLLKAIDNNNGKRAMLYEPYCFVMTGTRIPERALEEIMEEMGKKEAMKKLWAGAMPYLKCTANKSLFALADACLST